MAPTLLYCPAFRYASVAAELTSQGSHFQIDAGMNLANVFAVKQVQARADHDATANHSP